MHIKWIIMIINNGLIILHRWLIPVDAVLPLYPQQQIKIKNTHNKLTFTQTSKYPISWFI